MSVFERPSYGYRCFFLRCRHFFQTGIQIKRHKNAVNISHIPPPTVLLLMVNYKVGGFLISDVQPFTPGFIIVGVLVQKLKKEYTERQSDTNAQPDNRKVEMA